MALALTPTTAPNNLPRQLTSFIGRERESEEVKRLFAATRLLTLRGAGGSGKTRLAIEVASDLRGEYPDGVWFADLARLADPSLLTQLVASTLQISEQPGRDLTATLAEQLEDARALLVLDNCEHLVEACARLAYTLLHACPDLRILATSREALGLPGEIAWPVPPLSMPDPHDPAPLETLAQFEAVQLFVERARFKRSDFALSPANAGQVAQLCHSLDGMPLAIELAAARVTVLSVEQLLDRLSERFRLLTSGSQASLPRHQTLRALVDWSYDLLAEPERALLRRLSVFAGGFGLEAAHEVCMLAMPDTAGTTGGSEVNDPFATLDLLARLVDKSLVIMEEQGSEARYRLLETIRQYAWERLEESSEVEEIRSRHLEWYLKLAEEAEPQLRGPHQAEWSERLEAEHDNLRAALAWSQARGREDAATADKGLRLAGALWRFWSRRGYLSEGRGWLKSILVAQGAPGFWTLDWDSPAKSKIQSPKSKIAKALYGLGVLTWIEGDLAEARKLLEEAIAVCEEIGDGWGRAYSLTYLGLVVVCLGEAVAAAAAAEKSVALFREEGDVWGIALALSNLGRVRYEAGELVAAGEALEESLAIFREIGDMWGRGRALHNLGEVARLLGEYEKARILNEECLDLYRTLDHKIGKAWALHNMAYAVLYQGDPQRAAILFRESLSLYREQGDKQGIAMCLVGLARVLNAERAGSAIVSAQLLGAAGALFEAIGAYLWRADRADYEQCVAAVRAGLSDEAYEQAHAEGCAMSLEQAVALAHKAAAPDLETPQESAQLPTSGAATELTRREIEVLRLVASGLSSGEVAARLFVSPHTIHAHLHAIYSKLGVTTRAAATRIAAQWKLV